MTDTPDLISTRPAGLPQPRRYPGINWIGVQTLYLREVRRFWKVGAQTVAATRMIELGLGQGLGLSANGDFLYASVTGTSAVFGYSVQALIDQVETSLQIVRAHV